MALTPRTVRPGDVVCILFGLRVPIVLRPEDNSKEAQFRRVKRAAKLRGEGRKWNGRTQLELGKKCDSCKKNQQKYDLIRPKYGICVGRNNKCIYNKIDQAETEGDIGECK
jgi:hypothetical protein